MNKKDIKRRDFVCFINSMILLLFSSCFTVVESTGRVLDGSAFAEKTTATYRCVKKDGAEADIKIIEVQNKEGQRSVIIELGDFPMMKLRGTIPNENGEFYLTSLEYLSGNSQGWNEFAMQLAGEGALSLDGNAILQIKDEIEKVEISSARIRRYDTLITGSDALTSLRNRRERVAAIAQWMKSREGEPIRQSIMDFEKYWKPVLFPEMTAKRKRPEGWLQEGDLFNLAEDIRWNTSYTERVFNEELAPVRNSGTLLRDWEEALSWIYIEYEWDYILQLLSQETVLVKK